MRNITVIRSFWEVLPHQLLLSLEIRLTLRRQCSLDMICQVPCIGIVDASYELTTLEKMLYPSADSSYKLIINHNTWNKIKVYLHRTDDINLPHDSLLFHCFKVPPKNFPSA